MTDYDKAVDKFHYCPKRGHLYYKTSGRIAGGKASTGYWDVRLGKKKIRAHRVIWLIMTGDWPPEGKEIDHINRNKLDNRWVNLRAVSKTENLLNGGRQKNNTSGAVGVRLRRTKSGVKRWRSAVKINRKEIYIGVFDTKKEAKEAREAYLKNLNLLP